MTMWEFTLKFRLPSGQGDPAAWLDALFEAGCDDATVGVGRPGAIALDFSREAESAESAVLSAIDAVRTAIPGADLTEIGPDLVNLADLAELVGCSRQNLRKYAAGEIRTVKAPFPDPVYTGNPSLWRLAEVLPWLTHNTDLNPSLEAVELACLVSQANLEMQQLRLQSVKK